ncbi:histone-like nucleoid-structuring protein Lsr2 [Kitasatospora sp. NPDC096204]|uniref:Lsr2 family DNA-binding protein n=1 Tax=Kitasatospora sp. NPDC096204 TaxID=3364094 RepID=UPI003820F91C
MARYVYELPEPTPEPESLEDLIRCALDKYDGEVSSSELLRYVGARFRAANIREAVDAMPDVVEYFHYASRGVPRLLFRRLDKSAVRSYIVFKGLRSFDDESIPNSAEVRFYLEQRPKDDARLAKEVAERKRLEDFWADSVESTRKAQEHIRHMKKCREWGRENGFAVGARGAIPKAVREAYKESTGVEL